MDRAHTLQLASPAQDLAAVDAARRELGASILAHTPFVVAVEWTAPRTGVTVTLP